jgi:type I restriction enzyme R subunit
LNNLNSDLVQQFPDYVCRVTSDEGDIGRGHLSRFQELETTSPVILTTSQLLTTGVDAPTCKNIVLARVVNSMTEFKQIIGRGTRVRDDYGKYYFNILDYTGSATRLFADKEFDGDPAIVTVETIDDDGNTIPKTYAVLEESGPIVADSGAAEAATISDDSEGNRRKYYYDGGRVEIAAHLVYELDPDGKQLQMVKYTDYTADKVRTLFLSTAEMRKQWADPAGRSEILTKLEERGINFEELALATNYPEADPFDLLCHIAFNAPLRTRRERAERVRKERKDFFDKYGAEARSILEELLEKYAEHGTAQFIIPDALHIPPIPDKFGNILEITKLFGGAEQLRIAVTELQTLLYAA